MASLSSPTPAEGGLSTLPSAAEASDPAEGAVVVAGFGDPVAADYAAHLGRHPVPFGQALEGRVSALVLFLGPGLADRTALDSLETFARERRPARAVVVSSYRVHLGDGVAAQAEADLRRRLDGL